MTPRQTNRPQPETPESLLNQSAQLMGKLVEVTKDPNLVAQLVAAGADDAAQAMRAVVKVAKQMKELKSAVDSHQADQEVALSSCPARFIWMNGVNVPWTKAVVPVMSHTLHYGTGAFEGIRAYETKRGPAIFRLNDHIERLLYSARALKLRLPYKKSEIYDAIIDTVHVNKLTSCYIRPLVYLGEKLGLNPKGAKVCLAVVARAWNKYLPDQVKVQVSSVRRAHAATVDMNAKLTGGYLNNCLAKVSLPPRFHEALLLDTSGAVAEGPGENLFLVKNGKLYTPELGQILPGITRRTIIELAQHNNIEVIEARLGLGDLKNADEAFFTGTAAEVSAISRFELADRTVKLLPSGRKGSVTALMRDQYMALVHGEITLKKGYLTHV